LNILIKGATIITMESPEAIIPNGVIAVAGPRIVYVGKESALPGDFRPEKIIDATNMAALPGFVNCHTHAAMTLFRGFADDLPLMQWLEEKIWPLEAGLKKEDVYWGTLLACVEMIRSGTTTFADMYFHMGQAAGAVEKAGLRARFIPGDDRHGAGRRGGRTAAAGIQRGICEKVARSRRRSHHRYAGSARSLHLSA
jgi:Cytosine deaminase and related metal-dependent hydrolases